ncbi:MAG: hypothetical protein OSB58_00730 [Alphaproteobacteria bacterium]|jgi:hypothetical protein|nr:hypothetical protein [Alphaproteobacteria bacterium]
MSIRMEKPWQSLDATNAKKLLGQLGVYQISNDADEILYIGFAGGRSLFGLRGILQDELAKRGEGFRFRVEINQQYLSRWEELLKVHKADHNALPPENNDHRPRRIGQLSLS